jgi:hypothetical protein
VELVSAAGRKGRLDFCPRRSSFPKHAASTSYKDVTLRMGVACDLTGTGRTALKMTLGKYLEGAGVSGTYANSNPTLRMPQTTSAFGTAGVTRAWTDANQNHTDCDLMNAAAQDLRATGGDQCGVLSNTSFGTNVLTNAFAPALLEGGASGRPIGISASRSSSRSDRDPRSPSLTPVAGRRVFLVDNRALQPPI